MSRVDPVARDTSGGGQALSGDVAARGQAKDERGSNSTHRAALEPWALGILVASEEQKKVAVLPGAAPKDVINDPKRVDPTKPEGIAQSAMQPEQQATLAKLVREYLWSRRPDVAAEQWAKVEKAGLGNLYFAWAGETAPGKPHYYRVQGGNFVLEYDNTQNEANHVHCLWRDFDGDFGADLLKEHLDSAHKK